ncbi:MAG: hypothetical protein ABIY50_02555 [Ignavibacteria bacterium]
MKTLNKKTNNEFHAVEFMRKVRAEMSKEFLDDKQKYLKNLAKAMKEFKLKQKKIYDESKTIINNL